MNANMASPKNIDKPVSTNTVIDVERIRADFPILHQTVNNQPLVYLDNGATSQKPRVVIDAIARHYLHDNANVHRGVHELSMRSTQSYDAAREKVRSFINAADVREIVFTRGTTESINLVAASFGRNLKPGDEIILTQLEHHANIVPWQLLRNHQGIVIRVAPINDAGELILDDYIKLFNKRTRLVSVAHISNALGTVLPVKEIIDTAHQHSIPVMVDGAQAIPYMPVDVQDLDCDFYTLSGHKMYGPTGIGVLYGKSKYLEAMEPYQGGGDMILRVSFEETIYNKPPFKFEAGTPNISGAIGLGAAIDYLNNIGMNAIAAHEHSLLTYAEARIGEIPDVRIIGTAEMKSGILSFIMKGVHAHDIGTIMDKQGVAIRAGHHCAMPAMEHFGIAATARASFGLYNTHEEINALINAIHKVKQVLQR